MKTFALYLSALLLCASVAPCGATIYYVSSGEGAKVAGADSNNGTTVATPFATMQKAAAKVTAGDRVEVMDGTYHNLDFADANPKWDVVDLTATGTTAAWITFTAYAGAHPVISFNGRNGFMVWQSSASYIYISGITFLGNMDKHTLAEAEAQTKENEATFQGNAIQVYGKALENNPGAPLPHHYRILNNTISKVPGAGISAIWSDYITIQGNTIYDCCWYNHFGCSGISIWEAQNFDNAAGYHNIIAGNTVYNCHSGVKWAAHNPPILSDGNGIIIDDCMGTQNKTRFGPYTGRTLITNNVSAGNGGGGIHVYLSDHVDIVNNTTWHNSQTFTGVSGYGEIGVVEAKDINFINNIAVADANRCVNLSNAAAKSNAAYEHNLFFGGLGAGQAGGSNSTRKDPLLRSPSIQDSKLGDFRLQRNSPALDTGIATFKSVAAPVTDHDGKHRPVGMNFDLGAFEGAP